MSWWLPARRPGQIVILRSVLSTSPLNYGNLVPVYRTPSNTTRRSSKVSPHLSSYIDFIAPLVSLAIYLHCSLLVKMLLPSMPLSVALALSLSWPVFAAPQVKSSAGQVMSLKRRSPSDRTMEEWGVWAKNHKAGLEAKYGAGQPQKRSTGTNL